MGANRPAQAAGQQDENESSVFHERRIGRFSAISKLIYEGHKELNNLADHRRSTALFIRASLRNDQGLTAEEFKQFSSETRDRVPSFRRLAEGEEDGCQGPLTDRSL